MVEKKVQIINPAGLHTRPSATIVKIASKYKADFYMSIDGVRVNGKSIIGVMTLSSPMGTQVELEFIGEDEEKLAEEMCNYFERGFDEL